MLHRSPRKNVIPRVIILCCIEKENPVLVKKDTIAEKKKALCGRNVIYPFFSMREILSCTLGEYKGLLQWCTRGTHVMQGAEDFCPPRYDHRGSILPPSFPPESGRFFSVPPFFPVPSFSPVSSPHIRHVLCTPSQLSLNIFFSFPL